MWAKHYGAYRGIGRSNAKHVAIATSWTTLIVTRHGRSISAITEPINTVSITCLSSAISSSAQVRDEFQ
jgi:hypothetical protein